MFAFINRYHHTDTTMRYDANGNLILDIDRGISVIHYNLLNLPDTIQFGNGNQIVNLYDATGHKYRSIIYTVPSTAITPIHGIVHYALDVDTIDFLVTEYAGSIENKFSRTDTIQRIHNTIGYYTDGAYFHYLKDHLGNICAVVRSTTDDVVQQTQYYASGVPMQSNTLSVQPYLYNSKELVTAHELNEYDYGFRNYYTTIGRFTSMDPLAEQTPWQSPYSYAGNRFVNAIDWMGLSGLVSFNSQSYGWMAIDKDGNVVGWGDENQDWNVYEVDDDWDKTYTGLVGHSHKVGWEISGPGSGENRYTLKAKAYYLKFSTTVSLDNGEWNIIGSLALMFGNDQVKLDKVINNTDEAIWHYYFGDGDPIQNGPIALMAFMQTPKFRSIITNIANGKTYGIGDVNMTWIGGQFHIGHTQYSYQVIGQQVVIGYPINDGFWDPNFVNENIYKLFGLDFSDRKGPNLELGGTPYDYIPTILIMEL